MARQVCAAFAVIFATAGYLYPDVRAWLLVAAVAMLLTAVLWWTRLPTIFGALVAPLTAIALLVQLWLSHRG